MKTADANMVVATPDPEAGASDRRALETVATERLGARFQALTARRAGLALALWGEAGIGKSYQVARLLRGLPCRSLSLHVTAPMGELVRALPRPARLPLLATRVLDCLKQGQDQPASAVADALAAVLTGLSPFVLHLEDLHEAAPGRLELLEALAVRVTRSRGVGLLITSRTPPPVGFEPHRQHPLDARRSCELLEAGAGAELPPEALAWIYGRAAGNPLFTLEYFRLLARQGHLWNDARRWHWRAPPPDLMPVTVEALIERVLEKATGAGPLSDVTAARAMLPRAATGPQVAAVAGCTPAVAQRAGAELERLGVLAAREFAHPLYREVSLRMLEPDRRQALARRAVRAFAQDPELRDPELAASFLDAARLAPAPSLALLEQAARSAECAHRSADAAALWIRAADQAANHDRLLPERQAQLALQAARTCETVWPAEALRLARRAARLRPGDSETALYLAGRLVQHSRNLSDAEEVLAPFPAEVRSGPVWVSWQLSFLVSCGQYQQALSLWEAALGEAAQALPAGSGPGGPACAPPDPGTAYSLAACLVQTGQPGRAVRMARQGLDHPDTTPTQRASLLNVASIACAVTGQPQQAEAHLEAALDLARAHGLSQLRGALLQNRAKNLERTERFADALTAAQESFLAYAEAGDSLRHANAGVLVAGHLSGFGRFEEAETLLLDSLGVLERQGPSRFLVIAQTTLASLYLDWQPPHGAVLALKLARAALQQARLLGPGAGSGITAFALATLARVAAWAGDLVQALACAQEAVSSARQASDESTFLALAALAAAHAAAGQVPQARLALAEAHTAASAGSFALDLRRLTLEAARLEGDLSLAREQWAWFGSHGLLGGVKLAERAFPELAAGDAACPGPAAFFSAPPATLLPDTLQPDTLHLEVLGPMRLGFPGKTQPVRGRKRRELLAALLDARLRGRPEVPRLDLLDAVYPGVGELQAAASLRELVHLTRAAFGQGVIQTAPDSYGLGNLTSDAEQALRGGDTRLWRGPYFENAAPVCPDEAVGEALLLTLHARTEAALATDPHEAARCARLLLEADPYSHAALRLSLQALRAAGNHHGLTRLYKAAKTRFLEVGETLPGRWADFLA